MPPPYTGNIFLTYIFPLSEYIKDSTKYMAEDN